MKCIREFVVRVSLGFAILIPAAMVLPLSTPLSAEEANARLRRPVVSDWSHRHVLFPESQDFWATAAFQRDVRWMNTWYLRHPHTWWPIYPRGPFSTHSNNPSHRDWSVSLGTGTYGPLMDFRFTISTQSGYGSVNTTDQGSGTFLATVGSLTNTAGADIGTYPLYPKGAANPSTSPAGAFNYNDFIYYTTNPPLDVDGLLFRNTAGTTEINIWGNSTNNYSYYDHTSAGYGTQLTAAGTFTDNFDPGGGQTFPAKYVFDIVSTPSCTNDYVAIGIPATPASAGQANIVGYNNLYTGTGGLCGTGSPTVKFAYASGTGEVPASLSLSLDGTKIAYIENLLSGSSYFHVLKIGTTGSNGTSAIASVVPGTGNNATDTRVLLSPDGGTTKQSSTTAPFIVYTTGDANDVAYATTYTWTSGGSGYLYKIKNVFSGAPAIVWSAAINAVPSAPVYDLTSNRIFFTDSNGRIDYVTDNGTTASAVTYSSVLASGTISENPPIVDSTNQKVYGCFNSNGSNAIVVQATTNLAGVVSVPVGTASTYYTGPYSPEFNYAWYTGVGTPMMYVVGTGAGSTPTLYSVGFTGGVMNSTVSSSAPLVSASGTDASPPTEFYNDSLHKDYLFVGVDNNCIATTGGGTGGCVMSLDITSGFPTINASTTALPATGGTTGIIIDNQSTAAQASSIYYATKTGTTLVKATQSALQ